MIDLFSIVFSTGMIMLIFFRAIRLNAAGDPYPDDRNKVRALNDIGRRTNRDRIR